MRIVHFSVYPTPITQDFYLSTPLSFIMNIESEKIFKIKIPAYPYWKKLEKWKRHQCLGSTDTKDIRDNFQTFSELNLLKNVTKWLYCDQRVYFQVRSFLIHQAIQGKSFEAPGLGQAVHDARKQELWSTKWCILSYYRHPKFEIFSEKQFPYLNLL